MEVSSTNKTDETFKLSVDIDDLAKESNIEVIQSTKERSPVDDDNVAQIAPTDYDEDDDDSGEDIAVITKTSANVDLSPAKNMFSIKTIPSTQIHSNYKISKTAIDLDHPGNINGVPTIDYDLSKLTDECKPWKKPGADVSDFFNYGFTEETWLLYCEKQKALRLSHESSTIKTLSGLTNFGYNLSGSHIHLGFNRLNQKNSKGGLIDVIGCQQNGDFKNKHNDSGMSNKISTIPVQTGHMNSNQNQSGNYMSSLTSHAINNNLLNPLMSAIAMGMIPNGGNVLGNQQNMPIDAKISQYNSMDTGGGSSRNYTGHNNNNSWNNNNQNNNQNYERQNSVDSMHSHEEYNEKKYIKPERATRREEPRRYRSREKRDKSVEKRRRSRSRSRDRGHDSKYSRSSKRNRTPEDSSRRNKKKYSRERSKDHASSTESAKRRRSHRTTKKHRPSKSRSQERRHRHKSPVEDSSKQKHQKEGHVETDKSDFIMDNIKKEKDISNNNN